MFDKRGGREVAICSVSTHTVETGLGTMVIVQFGIFRPMPQREAEKPGS